MERRNKGRVEERQTRGMETGRDGILEWGKKRAREREGERLVEKERGE